MLDVPISNIPNQSFSINLDGSLYDINIQSTKGTSVDGTIVMAFDIVRDGTPVVTGARAVPGSFLIPAAYLENGNFFVYTMDDQYPDWQQFGITQQLIFIPQAELEAIRAGTGS